MQQFLLCLEPVLEITSEAAAITFENLVGPPCEGIEGVLDLVEQ